MPTLISQPAATEDAPQAIFIMGPTASGKTDLAVQCVQQLPCEIISVDSALVYKQMDIGTAKPDDELLRVAPHRLINLIEPNQAYSAARFRKDALAEMADIVSAGKIPLLVGGTMLYYKALEEGLAVLPSSEPEIRQQIEQDAERLGWQAMHQQLQAIDPVSAERIHPNDPQRIQRALEVYRATGRTMTDYWQQQTSERLPYKLTKIAFLPDDRNYLRQRIADRFQLMLKLGFIDEVRKLMARGDLHLDMPSMRCVGYRQVWQHLAGEMDYPDMVEKAITATRQLAKRQITWLRKQQMCNFFDVNPANFPEILKNLKNSLSL